MENLRVEVSDLAKTTSSLKLVLENLQANYLDKTTPSAAAFDDVNASDDAVTDVPIQIDPNLTAEVTNDDLETPVDSNSDETITSMEEFICDGVEAPLVSLNSQLLTTQH